MRRNCFTPALHLMHELCLQMAGLSLSLWREKCIYRLLVVPGGPRFPSQQYLIPLKCIIADQRVCDALFGV